MKSGGWLTSEISSTVMIASPQGVYGRRMEKGGVHVVSENYILDCITENKLIALPGMNASIDDDSLLSED
ncbi:hypothetical protein PMAYCL1PPCAC_21585 [Pristionchus mayeri]|uniref:BRCT domain-containing protein n=1 Tax=Pristionchus mayeri TaxID=1317129 RepID=A0AAN5I4S1_9BILA|nr:hypothetical protein PMAYCL1PPCAC_21585 [Pristionchus mayeri]